MTVAVLALAIALLIRLGSDTERLGTELAPQVDAAMEIKLEALHAHVLTEEIMGGDGAESSDKVWQHLEASRDYALTLLEGGETTEGRFFASDSPEVRARITEALTEFETVWTLTEQRFASLADLQGVGSEADRRFDALYDGIGADLAELAGAQSHAQDIQLQAAVGEARYRLAHGHLITAEILGGDLGEDFSEVTESFAAAGAALADLARPELFGALIDRLGDLSDMATTRYERTRAGAEAKARDDVTYDAAFYGFLEKADEAETMVQSFIAAELAKMNRLRWVGSLVFAAAAVLFLALCGLAYRLLSKRVIARVSELTGCIERVAEGDFEAALPPWTSQDELGRLKAAIASFQRALLQQRNLEEEARQAMLRAEAQGDEAEKAARLSAQANAHLGEVGRLVGDQSIKLIEISRNLSERQEQQAELLSDIAKLIGNVEGSATDTTQVVRDAIDVATKATGLVEEGNMLVARVVKEVEKITQSGQDVAGYVTTIEEISFQTNLLALNAAVEAARAGEAGRGFSIVAHEVRDLSQRTAQAASSIAELMTATNDYIRTGRDSVDNAKGQLDLICEAIISLERHLDTVGQSSMHQTGAVQEASTTVASFQHSFAETQKLANRCLEAGRGLAEQAAELGEEATEVASPHAA
ncbi:methyl-accepting chemotaxis protein [Yangia mangrovi]|nr:methyl-accepting chemotaxis protein [Alloyangia mangrovi]MCT4370032.1 methyl-accepting chemotaxis protein [Alloyangia mangrovi]